MANIAEAVRPLAIDPHAHAPLSNGRSLHRLFVALQREQLIRVKIEAVSPDSTLVEVHPDDTGAQTKKLKPSSGSAASEALKFTMVAASDRCVIACALAPGRAGDAPEGRALLRSIRELPMSCHRDRAAVAQAQGL